METEERTFPLTKLTSEVVAVAKATESDPKNKGPATSTNPRKRQLTLFKILKEIVRALGNSADSRQYHFLTRSLDPDTDDSESDPELDSELDS